MAALLNNLCKSSFRTSLISPTFYRQISLTITHSCSSKPKEQGEETHKLGQERCFGINYLKDGTDPPLLPDNEYPDWLWKLTEPTYTEESPEQTAAYWKNINKKRRRQENEIKKQKKI
ncbi:39S ribosomal protein L54, mitochondrial-like [Actinia tenebrosa]|uniref:Large ribosomal subunit protein mL54 n=1 Tax=Actinia tenebrosa TaxID=6105 RepID=A0A6P8HLI5_ACTTE|nr:39S ribosomal protein L54, mitochondrial-like [Actinia tenebrosa]